MTEIETTVKRVIRFDGEKCGEDNCDCFVYHFDDYCTLTPDIHADLGYSETTPYLRCPACIEEFGMGEE